MKPHAISDQATAHPTPDSRARAASLEEHVRCLRGSPTKTVEIAKQPFKCRLVALHKPRGTGQVDLATVITLHDDNAVGDLLRLGQCSKRAVLLTT